LAKENYKTRPQVIADISKIYALEGNYLDLEEDINNFYEYRAGYDRLEEDIII
jgi:hypothetical protein